MLSVQARIIGDSELILNEGDRVYHLNLHPDEIAETVITVGDPNRVSMVSRYFDRIEVKQGKRELVTHTGYIGNKRLTVLSTGMGTGNIDIVLNELDALHNICFKTRQLKAETKSVSIVRIGTSGAMQPEIPIDSFLLSQSSIGFESLLHYYQMEQTEEEDTFLDALEEYFAGELPVRPYMSSTAQKFETMFGPEVIMGITVTCGGFYAPQGRQLRAMPRIRDFIERLAQFSYQGKRMTNFEMETSAIYGLSRVLGFDCCSLNLMVANRHHKKFSTDMDAAMDRMIRFALERLTA